MTEANPQISFRMLDQDDLKEALAWRMEVLGVVFADDEPWPHDALQEANAAFLEEHLGNDLVYLIASVEGVEAGCGAFCIQPELPSPDNFSAQAAYLMNIYTRQRARGQGIGHAIVAKLIELARSRGIDKIYLETTESGRPVYTGLGFQPMENMMKLPLSDEPAS